MIFKRFQFKTDWEWLVITPSVILVKNGYSFHDKNFRLSVHWLGWHLSWLWIAKEDKVPV